MIATRIIDNDMGAVMKVPLTGVGTIHGLTMSIDFIIGQEMNRHSKKMEDVIERVTVPEFSMSLLEMLASDMGVTRVADHCNIHLQNTEREEKFLEDYKRYAKPIYASGKERY